MSRKAVGVLELEGREGEEAEATLKARLEMAVAAADRAEEGRVRQQLAELSYMEDRAKEARAGFRKALEIHLETGDLEGQSIVHGYLGFIAYDLDDFGPADRHLRQALTLLARNPNPGWEASVTMFLGALEAAQGKVRPGRKRLQRALALQQEIGDAEGKRTPASCSTKSADDPGADGARSLLRCRRRDSNPRHADYDSAALTS